MGFFQNIKDSAVDGISGLIEGDTRNRILQKLNEMGVESPEAIVDTIIAEIDDSVHERLKREYGESGLGKDFTRAGYTRSLTNDTIKGLPEREL